MASDFLPSVSWGHPHLHSFSSQVCFWGSPAKTARVAGLSPLLIWSQWRRKPTSPCPWFPSLTAWTMKLGWGWTGRSLHGLSFPGQLPSLAPRGLRGPEHVRVNNCRWSACEEGFGAWILINGSCGGWHLWVVKAAATLLAADPDKIWGKSRTLWALAHSRPQHF